ncbi:MAG: hypothetical protein R3C14_03200 [Caldilineaceae bacterium]
MAQALMVETRVTNLEELMAQLLVTVNRVDHQVEQLSMEMREFKDEMRDFKDEMSDFKDEMRDYKEESRLEIQKMRKQWGELSNRLGTMVEDLVAPSIGRILRTVVNCPEEQMDMVAIRVQQRRSNDNRQREFDAIAVCGEYMLINETKSRLSPEDITAFAKFLPEARTYFPQYADRKIIGAIASLYVDASLVRRGERLGLIVLGFGEDVMDVLNTPDFKPQAF